MTPSPLHLALLSLWTVALAASGYHAYDLFTWILEVFPAVIGIGLLILAYRRFRLTNLLYVLISPTRRFSCSGHYPARCRSVSGWRTFSDSRAMITIASATSHKASCRHRRELFCAVVRRGAWMVTVIILVCLGISAIYELFEWRTAVFSGSAAEAFLGTQGDPWDTQEDMAMAGVGASAALLLLSRVHDRALSRVSFSGSGAEQRNPE